jgi:hypothetical protein
MSSGQEKVPPNENATSRPNCAVKVLIFSNEHSANGTPRGVIRVDNYVPPENIWLSEALFNGFLKLLGLRNSGLVKALL